MRFMWLWFGFHFQDTIFGIGLLFQTKTNQQPTNHPCRLGTYSDSDGAIFCSPCGAGMFLSKRGASSFSECQICPPGSLSLSFSL